MPKGKEYLYTKNEKGEEVAEIAKLRSTEDEYDKSFQKEMDEYNLDWGKELGDMASDAWEGTKEAAGDAWDWFKELDPEKREAGIEWAKDVALSKARQESTIGDLTRKIQQGGTGDTRDVVGDVPRSLSTIMKEVESGKQAKRKQDLYENILANLALSKIPGDTAKATTYEGGKKVKETIFPSGRDPKGKLKKQLLDMIDKEGGGPELSEKGQEDTMRGKWRLPERLTKRSPAQTDSDDSIQIVGEFIRTKDPDRTETEIIKKGKPSSQSLSEIFEDIAMLIPMARGESEEVIDIKDVIDTYKKEKEEDRDIEMRKIYENKLKELRESIQSLDFGSSEKK